MFTSVCVNMERCEYIIIHKKYMYSTRCISSIDLYIYITYGIDGGGVLLCRSTEHLPARVYHACNSRL